MTDSNTPFNTPFNTPSSTPVSQATEATKRKIDETGAQVMGTVNVVRSYAKDAVDAAGSKLGRAQGAVDQAIDDVRSHVADAPIQSTLIAMGIGAALAVLRPWRLLTGAAVAGLLLQQLTTSKGESLLGDPWRTGRSNTYD
ncbi:MAG: hypothetical protein ABIW85_09380 [Variovorax sp.]